MQPLFVDLSAEPARSSGGGVAVERGFHGGTHLKLDAGGALRVPFTVPVGGIPVEATLGLRALVSMAGPDIGYAPLDVTVNDVPLLRRHAIPGGGHLPQDFDVVVPGAALGEGTNLLTIASAPDARTHLWLYTVLLEAVFDRGAARRAMTAEDARDAVLTFTTRRRDVGGRCWTPGPVVRMLVDNGQDALPTELTWNTVAGAETSLNLAEEVQTVYGHHRDLDGTWFEVQGDLCARAAFPTGPGLHRFATQEHWGGPWHDSSPLVLLLDAGDDGPLDRIAWRDQRGCAASVGLFAGGRAFLGWNRRAGENAIGYRGRVAPG